MPQFDYLIIAPLIKDLIVVLVFFYTVFFNLIVKSLHVLKFRQKVKKFVFKLNYCILTSNTMFLQLVLKKSPNFG